MSEAPVAMANLGATMGKMMGTLAKSDYAKILSRDLTKDIGGVGHSLNEMNHQINGIINILDKAECHMRNWKADVEKGIPTIKNDQTAASPGAREQAQPSAATWPPRGFHVRGWPPFGRDSTTKIRDLVERISARMMVADGEAVRCTTTLYADSPGQFRGVGRHEHGCEECQRQGG